MPLQSAAHVASAPEFSAPLTKVVISAASAAAVNADRIANAARGATDVIQYTHPMLELTWQNAAAFTATMVSLCVLADWFWKRVWRPLFERKGWIKPKKRRALTESQLAALEALKEQNEG